MIYRHMRALVADLRAAGERNVLTAAGSDLRIMVYTAEPRTEDADHLALLTILGTQDLATPAD